MITATIDDLAIADKLKPPTVAPEGESGSQDSTLAGQGSGVEGSASLPTAVVRPAWHQGLSWQARDHALLWRADETELVAASPIKPGGVDDDPHRRGARLGLLATITNLGEHTLAWQHLHA